MYPRLVLAIHIILIDCVFGWERAFHFADVVVDFLPAFLVNRAAQRPDHTKLEPQLDHACIVLRVRWINLQEHIWLSEWVSERAWLNWSYAQSSLSLWDQPGITQMALWTSLYYSEWVRMRTVNSQTPTCDLNILFFAWKSPEQT